MWGTGQVKTYKRKPRILPLSGMSNILEENDRDIVIYGKCSVYSSVLNLESIPAAVCEVNLYAWKSNVWQAGHTDEWTKPFQYPANRVCQGHHMCHGKWKGTKWGDRELGWSLCPCMIILPTVFPRELYARRRFLAKCYQLQREFTVCVRRQPPKWP